VYCELGLLCVLFMNMLHVQHVDSFYERVRTLYSMEGVVAPFEGVGHLKMLPLIIRDRSE